MTTRRAPTHPPSQLEVLLSGFVFPGAGQLIQGRWVSAVLFLLVAAVLVGVLLAVGIVPHLRNLRIVLGLGGHTDSEALVQPSIPAIFGAAGALLLVHMLNILDAALAHQRRQRRWRLAQRCPPSVPALPAVPDDRPRQLD